jgi:hypothetical protein
MKYNLVSIANWLKVRRPHNSKEADSKSKASKNLWQNLRNICLIRAQKNGWNSSSFEKKFTVFSA